MSIVLIRLLNAFAALGCVARNEEAEQADDISSAFTIAARSRFPSGRL
jgi:hypothetical protein